MATNINKIKVSQLEENNDLEYICLLGYRLTALISSIERVSKLYSPLKSYVLSIFQIF